MLKFLDMDDIEMAENWVHVIVEPIKKPFAYAKTNYTEAKGDCTRYTTFGFLINISPETLKKLETGELLEITV